VVYFLRGSRGVFHQPKNVEVVGVGCPLRLNVIEFPARGIGAEAEVSIAIWTLVQKKIRFFA